jgi:trk system potassium uptake protein TrkA
MLDYIEFDDAFAIVKMYPPKPVRGASLAASNIRKKYGITIVGVKSPGGAFVEATPETVISNHDLIIVSGDSRAIERFAALEG